MNHAPSILIKFIYTAAITATMLTFLAQPALALSSSLLIALLLTFALYLAGDLMVLPRYGNQVTVVFDFVLTSILLGFSNLVMPQTAPLGGVITSAIIIAAAEWLFHSMLQQEQAQKELPEILENENNNINLYPRENNIFYSSMQENEEIKEEHEE